MIAIDPDVSDFYHSVCFGVLSVQGFQARERAGFAAVKAAEIEAIRARHAGYERKAFAGSEPVQHYVNYYKGFKKTYHVLHQLESIVLKDKTIPEAEPLVQALFLAEVKHLLLIAGHDLDRVSGPLSIGLARGGERYLGSAGQDVELKAGDILMRDGKGVILSIIYGQDARTRIGPETRSALYLIDGVPGISPDRMRACLDDLLGYLRVFDPGVQPAFMDVLGG